MEYEIQRCTRHCTVTGRELKPGEDVFSVLMTEEGKLVRHDYAPEAWPGPPENAVGWWKSQIPLPEANRVHWAPNDVMLQLFEDLQLQPTQQDMRYVLGLLLVRRRVMRLEEEGRDEQGRETLALYCPRRETTYRVAVSPPGESRIDEIQKELTKLLFAHAS
jgi:hypothetical protein